MPGFGFGGPAVRVRGLDFAGPFRLRRSSVGIAKGATAARYLVTNTCPARTERSTSRANRAAAAATGPNRASARAAGAALAAIRFSCTVAGP